MMSHQDPAKGPSGKLSTLAYLCFDLAANETSHTQFVAEMEACPSPLSVNFASQARQGMQAEWRKQVQDRIGRSDVMVILVGKGTSSAANVVDEIALAKSRNVPFFGVYVDGADAETDLPAGLPRNRTIPWDWSRISSALKQLMHEGKHHVFV